VSESDGDASGQGQGEGAPYVSMGLETWKMSGNASVEQSENEICQINLANFSALCYKRARQKYLIVI